MTSAQENAPALVRTDPAPPRLWMLVVGSLCTILGAAFVAYYVYTWVLETYEVEPFEAARTAVTMIGVPTAAGAVFVALRTLRLKERQEHTDRQRLVDAQRVYDLSYNTEHTRRANEREVQLRSRYVSAAEQIGNTSAAVRLAGINAMAQLADDWEGQRQACVDVLCAYLRLPQLRVNGELDEADGVVRATVQQLLAIGLRASNRQGEDALWSNVRLDLRGAVLKDFDLKGASVPVARFADAVFEGVTSFVGAYLADASFRNAEFRGLVSFSGCRFERINFHESTFLSTVKFRGTIFEGMVNFADAVFDGDLLLDNVRSKRRFNFLRTEFDREPVFSGVHFDSRVSSCTVRGTSIPNRNVGSKKRMEEGAEARLP